MQSDFAVKFEESVGKETQVHQVWVTDYQPVSFYKKRLDESGFSPPCKNADVHVFYSVCSDTRNKSTRLENASSVLMSRYARKGNRVFVHATQSAGAVYFPSELDAIRGYIEKIAEEGERSGRKTVFMIESVGHCKVASKGGKNWEPEKSCYNCDVGIEDVDAALARKLSSAAQIWIPDSEGTPEKHVFGREGGVAAFIEKQYGRTGNPDAPGNWQKFIEGAANQRLRMKKQHERLCDYFSELIKKGVIEAGNIRAFVADLRDLSIWQVCGPVCGWNKEVYDLARLERNEEPYERRVSPPDFKILTLTHPDTIRQGAVAIAEIERLPRYMLNGRVYVVTSMALEKGMLNETVRFSLFYFAEYLKGRYLHTRGRTQGESVRLYEMVMLDPICNWITNYYDLKIRIHNNAIEERFLSETNIR